jgi:hypothetical protein
MNAQKLLEKATAAGLTVTTDGRRVVVRGPRRCAALAKQLIQHKIVVLEVLARARPLSGITQATGDGDTTPLSPENSVVPSPPPGATQHAISPATGIPARRLVGNGFPPRHSQPPAPEIVADPIVLCPRCSTKRVLPELRTLTGGRCYPCWEREVRK